MKLLFITDSIPKMVNHLKIHAVKKFGLTKQAYKTKWWFGERRKEMERVVF
jgi:hypothetical protein